MHPVLKTAMASALALATVAPAAAQGYGSPYRPTEDYIARQREYDAQRDQYEAQRDVYRDQRADYRAARADYDRRMADWEARRASYDARYGYGAYARAYGPAPVWDDRRWASAPPSGDYRAARADYERRLADWEARRADYDARRGYGAYARAYGPAPVWDDQRWASAPSAGYYGRDTAYTAPIRCNNNSAVTAGIIGAIAGSVLGSNVAGRGDRTEGAVLGGVVGAGLGAAVGHASDKYKCDQRGAYWTYNDTVPYRVSDDVYRDDRAAYYRNRRCRLAPAPVNDRDYRYVRVCPDSNGRYRVTG
ncbi:glycine zipper domain-containing protein [Phenylobacterium sp. LjRoot225]|uniref:glycine zipper 2TM domain-containing protein n=1 Tax=Phenylobacterium sp. LjRoot225 TaxID=3342285 RepID=UPI003ED01540